MVHIPGTRLKITKLTEGFRKNRDQYLKRRTKYPTRRKPIPQLIQRSQIVSDQRRVVKVLSWFPRIVFRTIAFPAHLELATRSIIAMGKNPIDSKGTRAKVA
ncbi:MAG: hypothetical protein OEZ24_06685, partial [Candidatus Bathyarchaeota archaeon]|nr:hypothetical protein [Candidatus Bathyarchaeota archaeon]